MSNYKNEKAKKAIVNGTDDYHEVMRSIVFSELPKKACFVPSVSHEAIEHITFTLRLEKRADFWSHPHKHVLLIIPEIIVCPECTLQLNELLGLSAWRKGVAFKPNMKENEVCEMCNERFKLDEIPF